MRRPRSRLVLSHEEARAASQPSADHDFEPEATVTPVGIFLPTFDEIFFYGVISKVTSDCLEDRWLIGGKK
jgi:hypothetical protein